MTHWTERLRDADEALARELSAEETQRLKRTVLAAASAGAQTRRWSLPFALTAGSLTAAAAALVLTTVMASTDAQPGGAVDAAAAAGEPVATTDAGPRQLHFSTPGGTRIIWVFDADFEVKGTLP
jgi:hypothetical protein